LPSQAPTGRKSVESVQVALPQLVPTPALAHSPLPSHVPLLPQGGLLVAQPPCGSMLPAATGWQDPGLPVRLQTWQLPQLALEQQTPSTQLPLSHSVPAAQSWPRRLRPQAPLASQNLLGAQSALLAHTATQALPVAALQAKGAQDCVDADLQVPLPSQVRARLSVTDPLGQEGPAHWVLAG
jgi:hypothetical protein